MTDISQGPRPCTLCKYGQPYLAERQYGLSPMCKHPSTLRKDGTATDWCYSWRMREGSCGTEGKWWAPVCNDLQGHIYGSIIHLDKEPT